MASDSSLAPAVVARTSSSGRAPAAGNDAAAGIDPLDGVYIAMATRLASIGERAPTTRPSIGAMGMGSGARCAAASSAS